MSRSLSHIFKPFSFDIKTNIKTRLTKVIKHKKKQNKKIIKRVIFITKGYW
jgi:hypothetical protein